MQQQDTAKVMSDDQYARFLNEGYTIVENVVSVEDLQPVVDELTQEIDARARQLVEKGELSSAYDGEDFETRLARISAETDSLAISIWNGILHGPAIFHLITHPRVLDLAEQVCGPEVIASSVYRLRPKIPNYGYGAVPWHQDSSYFEPYCDDSLVLTMWIPLVDATEENGCLWVIPGSHREPVVPHRQHASGKYLEISEDNLPEGERICCPVHKGGILLLTNRTVHGSFLNKTGRVRWSMDLRYQNAALPTNAPITRVAGEDVESVDLGIPAACYPPEADFLARSRTRPEEVTRTPEAFQKLREAHAFRPVTDRWGATWGSPVQTGE